MLKKMAFRWFKSSRKNKKKNIERMKGPPPLNDFPTGNQEEEEEEEEEEKEEKEMKEQNGKLKDLGKLFVGGLNCSTTKSELENYFSRFGTVVDAFIPRFPNSEKSQGYGFVTFSSSEEAKAALQKEIHILDERLIDVRPFNSRRNNKENGKARIFLGGLPCDITEENIKDFFSRYGEIVEVFIPRHKDTKKPKGFGFLSFNDECSAEKCEEDGFVFLKGRRVQIKKAETRDRCKSNDGLSTCSFSESNFYEILEQEKEDSVDTQSIGSDKEFLIQPALRTFFENKFLEKLARVDVMEDEKSKEEVTEVEKLLADFLIFSNHTRGALGRDLIEFSDEETENEKSQKQTNVAGVLPSSSSSSSKILETNKKSTDNPKSASVFDDSEFSIIQKSMPLQIRNKEGFLVCSLCEWISANDSSESFLAHCKTSIHRTKLKDRFSSKQTNKQLPKTAPGKSSGQSLVVEAKKKQNAKSIQKDQKQQQQQQQQPPKTAANINKQQTDSKNKSKKQETFKNPKIHALAKGMTSIQPFSKDELICTMCDKKIPKASELDALMKNVSVHLESKKHLKKLSEIENSMKSSSNSKENDNQKQKNQVKNPKKDPEPKRKTNKPAPKVKNSAVVSNSQNEKPDDAAKVRFLCLACNVSCQTIEVFNMHFNLKSHTDSLLAKNLNPSVCLTNMGKCKGCQSYLYGSLYDINKHCSDCV